MFPLLNIRFTYIKRNFCICFFNYFSFGILLLIIVLLAKILGYERTEESKRNLDKIYPEGITRFPNPEFVNKIYYDKVGLISKNKQLFNEFNKTFKHRHENDLVYFENEKESYKYNEREKIKINNLFELIQIKNDSFNFKFRSDKIDLDQLISDEESDLICSYGSIQTELDYWSFPVHNFLLNYFNKINNKTFNIFSYGFSDKRKTSLNTFDNYTLYFYPLSISLFYGIIFLNISLRMIDEKEKKLDILLNRYGIKKNQYYISWFLYYIILTIFINICTIFTFSYLTFHKLFPYLFLFIINHILFSIGFFQWLFLFI